MIVVVAEKPSVARDIASVLGANVHMLTLRVERNADETQERDDDKEAFSRHEPPPV